VRIGNSAFIQTQHDVMGEMIVCLETVLTDPRIVVDQPEGLLSLVERLVEAAIQTSTTQDTGIATRMISAKPRRRFPSAHSGGSKPWP